jgi:hypothetical protein
MTPNEIAVSQYFELDVNTTAGIQSWLEFNILSQIDAIDHQIDRLVYELYGLTEEEIKIIEGQ